MPAMRIRVRTMMGFVAPFGLGIGVGRSEVQRWRVESWWKSEQAYWEQGVLSQKRYLAASKTLAEFYGARSWTREDRLEAYKTHLARCRSALEIENHRFHCRGGSEGFGQCEDAIADAEAMLSREIAAR